jgi:Ca2+-binding RTX toxin-like protein/methionine-rich copper-binding protein CopC
MRHHLFKAGVGRLTARSRTAAVTAGALAALGLTPVMVPSAQGAVAPVGQGFTVTAGDLSFILKQIKISERHAHTFTADNPCGTLVGPDRNQIPDRLASYGLRTVDGSCNNLFPGRETFAAADQPFPRLTRPVFQAAEDSPAAFGPPHPTSYAQKKGSVFDSEPRTISNLIVDQTSNNPAAVAAAAFPVRTQGNLGLHACTTDPAPDGTGGVPAGCVPSGQTLFIPNVTTDVGLSPPYNSMFTFFGQFFDHGVDQTVKSGGTVFVPLKDDDPLIAGKDLVPGNADDPKPGDPNFVPADQRFMVLTRAQNQPGPDGVLGDRSPTTPGTSVKCTSLNVPDGCDESADDVQNANNTDSPWVDQSQTYTSHASHQVFLREYATAAGKPVATGKMLGGLPAGETYDNSPDGTTGMATWASVKKQAHDLLGIQLVDMDVLNVPMLATDPYGEFIPGDNGLPQFVTKSGLQSARLDDPTTTAVDETAKVPADVLYFDTPFLTDIAHNADPSPQDTDHNPATDPVAPRKDDDSTPSADFASQPSGTYDDEMLNAHFCAGDGRVNENIALTTIHQVFHSEHDRLVDDIQNTLNDNPALLAAYKDINQDSSTDPTTQTFSYGDRLFQAARFVTEMEYQHLVFEEFGRKVQPAIRPFHVYSPDVNPAIQAEFAHAVYRFGHSMLDDDVARVDPDRTVQGPAGPITVPGGDNSVPLLTAFLNPPEYQHAKNGGPLTPEQAAGSVVMGSSDQTGNELDEFVTETLRNNLLGLPLDLPTLNMTRARDAGVPPLNEVRRQILADTNDGQLAPYTSWSDFGQHLKHPESLVNFVAAYGKHPTILDATTIKGKRAAARAIVDPGPTDTIPDDAADFMFSTGAWASSPAGVTKTGLDDVDLWVGGLAEVTNLFGGLLGSTFNYVFQTQMESLQDGDRLYYLNRTPGMNLRTQLEGNSFSEMIQRNTDGTNTLKADVFATADCKFQLSRITGPYDGSPTVSSPDLAPLTGAISVNDDPKTPDCDENQLLLRKPDGTIQYRAINKIDPSGINGQSVYNGTAGVDRMFGGNDNDTFWGGDSRDWIEGNGGDDVALGGDGNDIITDLGGADVLKGGPGNDATDGGIGDDIFMGGDGQDFINGGANDNEAFAGPGNDFVIAGQGADAVFGDGGDDWIQGGSGQDLLQGDHGAPFFDDPAESKPGNDVFVGQNGENDYDAEGGDDIMAQNAFVDRNAGAGGFDWAIHQYDTVGANDDMMINNNLGGLPIQVIVNRDRWQETEADSGGPLDDVIKGTDGALATPRLVGGGGFTGCDAIDQAGLDRIPGLSDVLPPVGQWVGTADAVAAISASGACPLEGPVWGEGDILIGGGGSDTLEGRDGDDILDGDRQLEVRIAVLDGAGNEIGSTDLMEHQALTGTFGDGTAGMNLQAAVFAGLVDPGNLVARREIKVAADPAGSAASADTAVFTGSRTDYNVTTAPDGTITVTDTAGTDGTDTVRNVELLKFADQTVDLRVTAPGAPVIGAASAGPGALEATVRWTAPSNTGGSPITFYRVQVFEAPVTAASTPVRTITGIGPAVRQQVVTGLAPGSYAFKVRAENAIGLGPVSDASNTVVVQDPTPTVSARTPASGATNVSVPTNVTVTFDRPVTGVTASTFRLRNLTTNALVAATVTLSANGLVATANPNPPLPNGTVIRVELVGGAGGIRSVATGTPIADQSWSFTTAVAPLVVTARTPAAGATRVNLSANVTATFNRPVQGASTTTVRLVNTRTGNAVNARVTVNTGGNGRVITLNPNANLARNTVFRVTLTGGASGIRDLSNVPFAGDTWTFRTRP